MTEQIKIEWIRVTDEWLSYVEENSVESFRDMVFLESGGWFGLKYLISVYTYVP